MYGCFIFAISYPLTVCLKITPAFHFKDILVAILMLVVILFPWVIIGAKWYLIKKIKALASSFLSKALLFSIALTY